MFLLSALLVTPSAQAQELSWKQIYEQDGIVVSKSDVPGTKLVAFRGETVMDASVGSVLRVLLDHEHRLDWVGRLVKNEVLEQDGPYDFVAYQVFNLPAPISDRDYVYRAVATHDPGTGVVTQSLQSVEHAQAPESVGVRANLVNSRYVLTPQGGKTKVEVEILTDPRGTLPAWLVNMIQRSWPADTLGGIRAELGKGWVVEHPLP